VIKQTGAINDSIAQAEAIVEYLGSPDARKAARDIYKAACDTANIFCMRQLEIIGAEREGIQPAVYDAEGAKYAITALCDAIDRFIDAINPAGGAV
jgi:hypothetical protein